MNVVGNGGAVTITATNAIVNGTFQGDLLTLRGTSNTNTVTIPTGVNVVLRYVQPMILAEGDSISFVYMASGAAWGSGPWGEFPWGVNEVVWWETSRYKGGI